MAIRNPRPVTSVHDGFSLFFNFMRDFTQWSNGLSSRVSKAFIKPGDNETIEVHLIRRVDGYDSELQRLFSEFKQAQFDAGLHVRGLILPDGTDEELQAFFAPAASILIPMR